MDEKEFNSFLITKQEWNCLMEKKQKLEAENAELKARWEKLNDEIEKCGGYITPEIMIEIIKQLSSGGELPRKAVGYPDEGEPAMVRGRTPKPEEVMKQAWKKVLRQEKGMK